MQIRQILFAFDNAHARAHRIIHDGARIGEAIIDNIRLFLKILFEIGHRARQRLIFRSFTDLIELRIDAARLDEIMEIKLRLAAKFLTGL